MLKQVKVILPCLMVMSIFRVHLQNVLFECRFDSVWFLWIRISMQVYELVVNGANMAGQDICVVCHVTAMIWSQLRCVTFFYISLEWQVDDLGQLNDLGDSYDHKWSNDHPLDRHRPRLIILSKLDLKRESAHLL